MKEKLLEILVCPKCKENLECLNYYKENGEIKEGILKCKNQHSFPIKNFLPYFSPQKRYVEAFDFMWKSAKRGDLSSERDAKIIKEITEKKFLSQTQLNPNELNDKLILDVGCGSGRFIEYLNKFGAEIVGIDLLEVGLNYCINRFKDNNKTHFIQADLFNLPFKENTFDFIYSFGVLHHTPNPKDAFMGLVRFLKDNGHIAIWVYSDKTEKTRISDILRPVTIHLPKRLLYYLGLFITAGYGPLLRVPKVGRRLKSIFYRVRIPWHDHWNWRIHSFLDWYGPTYQSKHSYEELESWFQEAGLSDIVLCPYPVSARRTKRK